MHVQVNTRAELNWIHDREARAIRQNSSREDTEILQTRGSIERPRESVPAHQLFRSSLHSKGSDSGVG